MAKKRLLKGVGATLTILLLFTGFLQYENLALRSAQAESLPAQPAQVEHLTVQPLQTKSSTNNDENEELQRKSASRSGFLDTVTNQLQVAQGDYAHITNQIKDTEKKLQETQGQKLTLQSQLDALNMQIINSIVLIQNVTEQIVSKENALAILNQEIELKDAEINHQKQMLLEYLEILYREENGIRDTTRLAPEVNIVKLLLSNQSTADVLRKIRYFNILEETDHAIFEKLERLFQQQQSNQTQLENSRNKLTMLYRTLDEEKQSLKIQSAAKAHLLDETKGQERIYEQLVEESRLEQARTIEDIATLRGNLDFIKQKVTELGDKFDPQKYKNIFGRETTSVYEFISSTKEKTDVDFVWPVSPARGISAYFHDEAYRRSMGILHNAIDIRVPHGTPIRAPADGVVYKTQDNGFGYSYIILAHTGGFLTVYGHVSEIHVVEGEKVSRGHIIGLSGATPGSKGAGLITTGPHLHFEMLQGGKHVDPLDFLPLGLLPLEGLPERYLSRATGDKFKVRRVGDEEENGANAVRSEGNQNDSQELLRMIENSGYAE